MGLGEGSKCVVDGGLGCGARKAAAGIGAQGRCGVTVVHIMEAPDGTAIRTRRQVSVAPRALIKTRASLSDAPQIRKKF